MSVKPKANPAKAKAANAAPGPPDDHGSSNPHPKPPVTFDASPNHSSRNGARITFIVLHCTEASLASTLATFKNPGGRQVSAHYVIARNGAIIQMVQDSERANHCRGANSNSIGIEHVGSMTDVLAPAQEQATIALIRWLLEQYDIPRQSIFGHDFAPGGLTRTSCPDRLFGTAHTQATINAWVAANI